MDADLRLVEVGKFLLVAAIVCYLTYQAAPYLLAMVRMALGPGW